MSGPTPQFWQAKFEADETPWDRGAPHPQLLRWLADGHLLPSAGNGTCIAVPGCGSGHEVLALADAGFAVTAIDYTAAAVARARGRLAASGRQAGDLRAQVLQADVLSWQPAQPLDAVYEQTCLCALHPDHWTAYAAQLRRWLQPGGRLFALFMQAPKPGAADGIVEGPPYHCDIHAVRALFHAQHWEWPKPPFARVPHPRGIEELAVVLQRR